MENRKIISPGVDTDVEINPSGDKRAKVSHLGGIIIGNDPNDTNNVKLHRGPAGSLQVVAGDDATTEGLDSPNKKIISVASINVLEVTSDNSIIGSSLTPSENIKLRRSGISKFEVAIGDASSLDGASNPTQRAQTSMASLLLGNDSTESNNVMLLVSPVQELDFQEGDATSLDPSKRVGISSKSAILGTKTAGLNTKIYQSTDNTLEIVSDNTTITHGTPTSTGRQGRNSLQVKDLVLGIDSSTANNTKLHRGFNAEVEVVQESDSTSDGTRSANKVQLNAKTFEVGSDALNTNNVKIHKGQVGELEIVAGGDSTLDGTRSATKAQLNAKAFEVGSDALNTNNVKIHRGQVGELEVVSGGDSALDGIRSSNKVQLNVQALSIGKDQYPSGNIKLHRGAIGVFEIISADSATPDNILSPDRVSVNVKELLIGSSITNSTNTKLHKATFGELEVVTGDDPTLDNAHSPFKAQFNAKKVSIGSSVAQSENVKLHRGNVNVMEVVLGDDTTLDGFQSSNKAALNVKSLAIGSSASGNNVALHRGAVNLLQVMNGAEVSTEGTMSTSLSNFSFLIESTTGISASGQEGRPAWDSTKKSLAISDGTVWKYIGENKSVGVMENIGFTLTPNSPIANNLTIALKQADCSSDPTSAKPVRVSFRDSTATSAVWSTLSIESALSLTLTLDAKLGVTPNIPARVYIYLLNNSGTPEFAVSQKFFNGDDLETTEALSSSSDYIGKIYSVATRTSVPLTCLGYFEATLVTPGYWGSGPITSVHNGVTLAKDDKLTTWNAGKSYGPGDIAISGDKVYSTTSITSTSYVSGSINFQLSSTGRPIQIMLQPADPQSSSFIKLEQASSTTDEIIGHVAIYRKTLNDGIWTYGDNTANPVNEVVAQFELKIKAGTASEQRELELPPSVVTFLDLVGSGTQYYTLCVKVDNATSKITLSNVRLIGYEI